MQRLGRAGLAWPAALGSQLGTVSKFTDVIPESRSSLRVPHLPLLPAAAPTYSSSVSKPIIARGQVE